MALVPTFSPTVEPVSLAEVKAHLRIDGTDDDTLLASLILTSRLHIEAALGLALVTQGWALFRDVWPKARAIPLPIRPVQSLTAVRLHAREAPPETLDLERFVLDGAGIGPRLLLADASAAPPTPDKAANGLEIVFTAGYGDAAADVPAPIRHALLLLVAHWYEHRAPFECSGRIAPVPATVSELLLPYRSVRL
jgi:uncharacterized phiE125 gp8 family phage protein